MWTEAARPCLFRGRAKPPRGQEGPAAHPAEACTRLCSGEERVGAPPTFTTSETIRPISKAEPSLRNSLIAADSSSRKPVFMALRTEVPYVAPALACLSFLTCESSCFLRLLPSTELRSAHQSQLRGSQSAALRGCQGLAGLRKTQLTQAYNCCCSRICSSEAGTREGLLSVCLSRDSQHCLRHTGASIRRISSASG